MPGAYKDQNEGDKTLFNFICSKNITSPQGSVSQNLLREPLVVRESQYKSLFFYFAEYLNTFGGKRTEKFGNHWPRAYYTWVLCQIILYLSCQQNKLK